MDIEDETSQLINKYESLMRWLDELTVSEILGNTCYCNKRSSPKITIEERLNYDNRLISGLKIRQCDGKQSSEQTEIATTKVFPTLSRGVSR